MECERLKEIANRLRAYALWSIYNAKSGHPGGSLSCADIIAALYFKILNVDPNWPSWPKRDRFVLSKGHACPILYAALALRGFFPKELLATLRNIDSPLQGHPDPLTTPGLDSTAGSLGQGLSISLGMALATRLQKSSYHVFCLLGEGDMQEGQTWEAISFASHYRVNNLTAIADCNGLQGEGEVAKIHNIEPLANRWRSFGWNVFEIDGHDMTAIVSTLETTKRESGGPCVVIAHTTKGKGVSFMENRAEWHGSRGLTKEEFEQSIKELGLVHEFELRC